MNRLFVKKNEIHEICTSLKTINVIPPAVFHTPIEEIEDVKGQLTNKVTLLLSNINLFIDT